MRVFQVCAVLALVVSCGSSAVAENGANRTVDKAMSEAYPLDAFFAGSGGLEGAQKQWDADIERQTAVCMKAAGFEYVPKEEVEQDIYSERRELSERQWTERYGYGIVDGSLEVLGSNLIDRNSAYRNQLSESEAEQYQIALLGSSSLDSTSSTQPAGCVGMAIERAGDELLSATISVVTTYSDRMARVNATTDMREATNSWQLCMAESGYHFRSPVEAADDVRSRFDEALIPVARELQSLSQEEATSLIESTSNPWDLPGYSAESVDEVKSYELAVALADLECFVAHIEPAYGPAREAVEAELVREFRSDLEAFRDAVAR